MLGKLFRHDMRALSKTLRWVVLGVVALALLASLVTAIELRMSVNNYADFLQNTQLYAMFGMTQMLTVIGVAASGLLALFFICRHFYRNLFCDEGYLTHTLPVSPAALLGSKLLAGQVWMLLSSLSIVLALALFLLLGTSAETLFNTELFREMFRVLTAEPLPKGVGGLLLQLLLYALAASVAGMLQLYMALTIGCAIGRKHRVAIAVCVYIGLAFAVSMLSAAFSLPVLISQLFAGMADGNMGPELTEQLVLSTFGRALWVQIGVYAALAAGYFFLAEHLMRRKLNLQ